MTPTAKNTIQHKITAVVELLVQKAGVIVNKLVTYLG